MSDRQFIVSESILRKAGLLAFDEGSPCIRVGCDLVSITTVNQNIKRVQLAGFEIAGIKPQADIPSCAKIYAEWVE